MLHSWMKNMFVTNNQNTTLSTLGKNVVWTLSIRRLFVLYCILYNYKFYTQKTCLVSENLWCLCNFAVSFIFVRAFYCFRNLNENSDWFSKGLSVSNVLIFVLVQKFYIIKSWSFARTDSKFKIYNYKCKLTFVKLNTCF